MKVRISQTASTVSRGFSDSLGFQSPAFAHLLPVPGDPGVQQQLQPLSVIPPGGFHRYDQVSGGEMLQRRGRTAAPRGDAYSSSIASQFLEIRRENSPARRCRCSWTLPRVSDGQHERPGHQQTGDRGGGAGRALRFPGGFPHGGGAEGFTASLTDREASEKLLCGVYRMSTALGQSLAVPGSPSVSAASCGFMKSTSGRDGALFSQ